MASLSREEKLQLASQKLRQFQQSKQAQADKTRENPIRPAEPATTYPESTNSITRAQHSNVPSNVAQQTPSYSAQTNNTYTSSINSSYQLQPQYVQTASFADSSSSSNSQMVTDVRSLPTSSTEQMRELVAHCNTLLNSVESVDDDTTIDSDSDAGGEFRSHVDSRHRDRLVRNDEEPETERLRERNLELVRVIETLRNEADSRQIELTKYRRLFESLEREYGEALRSASPQHTLSVLQRSLEQLASECAEQTRKATLSDAQSRAANARLDTERAQWTRQVDAMSAENSELRRKLAFIEQQNVALQDSVSRAARDSGKLEHDLVAARTNFDAERSRFERELARLETQVAMQKSALQSEMETVRAELETTRSACRIAEASVLARRDEEGELSETRAALGRVRVEFDSETRRLRTELDAQTKRFGELEVDMRRRVESDQLQLQRTLDENAALKRALEEVAVRFSSLETAERDAKSDAETVRVQLAAVQQRAAERDRLETRLQEASRKFDADLRVKHERILELEMVIEDRDARLRRADVDLRNADSESARMRNAEAELARLRGVEVQLRDAETELSKLRTNMSGSSRNYEADSIRLRDSEAEVVRLRHAEAELRAEVDRLKNDAALRNAEAEVQLRNSAAELDRLRDVEAELRKSDAELSRLRHIDLQLRKHDEAEAGRVQNNQVLLDQLSKAEAELSQLRIAESEIVRLRQFESEFRKAEAELSRLRAVEVEADRLRSLQSTEQEKDATLVSADELHRVEEQAEEQIALMRAECERYVADVQRQLESHFADYENGVAERLLSSAKAESNRTIAELQRDYEDRLDELSTAATNASRELDDARAENAATRQRFEQALNALQTELQTERTAHASSQATASLSNQSAAAEESAILRRQLEAVTSRLRVAESSVDELRATESTLTTRCAELSNRVALSEAQARAAASDVERERLATAQLAARLRDTAAFSDAFAALRSEADACRNEAQQITAERDRLLNELEAVRSEHNRVVAQLATAITADSVTNTNLAQQAENVHSSPKVDVASLADLESSNNDAEADTASQPADLNKELHRIRGLLVRREAEVHRMGAEMTRLAADRSAIETRCAQHESVAAFLRRRNAELEHAVEQLAAECESIGDYIAMYHSQRHALLERVERKKTLLHRLLVERRLVTAALAQLRAVLFSDSEVRDNAATGTAVPGSTNFANTNWPKLDSDSDSECEKDDHVHGQANPNMNSHMHNHSHSENHDRSLGFGNSHTVPLSTSQINSLVRILNELDTAMKNANSTLNVGADAQVDISGIDHTGSDDAKSQPASLAGSLSGRVSPVSLPSPSVSSPVPSPSPPLDRVLIDDAYFAPCKHCSGKLITV